ncbi:MAG: aminotransferase class V-fold PLP-dependent enzyme [Chloroflexi bacterium]|nr:aminotransferase class V-fold PLP-dependent enzyme [Chloroflexota bacterium]
MSVLDRLDVEPVINAGGPNTKHSGSRPREVAMEAMQEASGQFYNIDEFIIEAGKAIAELIGAPAATITSGASGGLVVQAAAAIARDDPDKIAALPNTDGMANDLIIQKHHRFIYDHLYLTSGGRFKEVGDGATCSPDEVEDAIDENTAAIIHLESPYKRNDIVPLEQLVEIAHRHDLPVLCDAASMLPPRSNLKLFLDQGADLVSFSGGKGIRGPQSTGVLAGTPEWVEYARLNNFPNVGIARAQKVSKEEMAGLVAALGEFVETDEEDETKRYSEMMQMVVDQIIEVPGIAVSVVHDRDHYIPHAVISFSSDWRGPDRDEIHRRLMAGTPRIYVANYGPERQLVIDPLNIQEGELEIVAERVRNELVKAASGE